MNKNWEAVLVAPCWLGAFSDVLYTLQLRWRIYVNDGVLNSHPKETSIFILVSISIRNDQTYNASRSHTWRNPHLRLKAKKRKLSDRATSVSEEGRTRQHAQFVLLSLLQDPFRLRSGFVPRTVEPTSFLVPLNHTYQ